MKKKVYKYEEEPLPSSLFIVDLHMLPISQVYLTCESLSNDQKGKKNLHPLMGGLRSSIFGPKIPLRLYTYSSLTRGKY